MEAVDSTQNNEIVNYLNNQKMYSIDKGRFEVGKEINISKDTQDVNVAIESQLKPILRASDPIKLIILTLKNGRLNLDCDIFLKDVKKMNDRGGVDYIKLLNHLIVGKTDDAYSVIGYNEDPTQGTQSRPAPPCYKFKLNIAGKKNTCALLPEIIKGVIFECVMEYYTNESDVPGSIEAYYVPIREDVAREMQQEEAAVAAEAAAEVRDEDKCDFKRLLKSNIKNEEG